jgi:hypothetical protein
VAVFLVIIQVHKSKMGSLSKNSQLQRCHLPSCGGVFSHNPSSQIKNGEPVGKQKLLDAKMQSC